MNSGGMESGGKTSGAVESGGFVSVALVRHLLDLTAWQGQPAPPILEAAGVTPGDLADTGGWLPVARARLMVHAALRLSQDPLFYLKLSQLTFLSGYGIVGYLLESSPTLKDAIHSLFRYERLISNITFSRLDYQPGQVGWAFECRTDDAVLARHMTEFHTGSRYLFMLMVNEKRSRMVKAVHFRHSPPENMNYQEEYGKIFRCPVLFDQPESALILSPHALSLPLRQVEPGLKDTLEAHADKKMRELMVETESLIAQVRAQLRMLLLTCHPTRELLAERLGVSSRHLHRQLQQEGTSYRALLDELRLELAQQTLRETGRTVDEIGRQLSFSDGQSFIRWFRQMTGHTPGDFRQHSGAPA